jgi:hypothetical protein
MPYVQGGTSQGNSGRPEVVDVFHSGNVFANNVPIALWQAPISSASIAYDVAVPQLSSADLDQTAVQEAAQLTSQPMPATAVAQGAIEADYQGTPSTAVTTSTGEISTATSSDIVTWLSARLDEAGRGMWTRQSPPAGKGAAISPGNPNITGIWSSIGLSAYSNNDQTAWCMGFVNFALKQCGYRWCKEASARSISANPARWNAKQIPLDQGEPGDIALWSYSHVNFIYKNLGGKYTFVGGNQGGKEKSNNNPQTSTVSESWGGGYKAPGDGSLVSIWRPSKE